MVTKSTNRNERFERSLGRMHTLIEEDAPHLMIVHEAYCLLDSDANGFLRAVFRWSCYRFWDRLGWRWMDVKRAFYQIVYRLDKEAAMERVFAEKANRAVEKEKRRG